MVTIETLIETNCANCGIVFAVPRDWLKGRQETGKIFFCPNGHTLCFEETEAMKLRKELAQTTRRLDETQTRLTRAREAHDHQERLTRAAKGQVTKLKNRIAGGVCPCCNRFFSELASHVRSQHPDFRDDPEQPQVEALCPQRDETKAQDA